MHPRDKWFDTVAALCIILMVLLFVYRATAQPNIKTPLDAVHAIVDDFFGDLYQHRRDTAKTYSRAIVDACTRYGVDPALVAVVICYESGWNRHDIGPKGEKGLMQIKPRPNYQPPTDPELNIDHGVKYLADKIKECGSVLSGLSAYQSGRCTPIIRQARYRYAVYERFKRYGTIRKTANGAEM